MTEPAGESADVADLPPGGRAAAENVNEPTSPASTATRTEPRSWWQRRKLARADERHARNQQRLDARFGQARLSPEQLTNRLFRKSTRMVAEIHSLALRQIQSEEQRESRLDGKAQGLLVTAGLSLTAASTFGGIFLQHPEYMKLLGRLAPYAVLAYSLALASGVGACACAVHALFVRGEYQSVDEQVVLDENALTTADGGSDEAACAAYQRYMTVHYWQMWQQHFGVHQEKAGIIHRGQMLLMAFLVMVMLVGFAIAYSAYRTLP